ncbi:MAG: murein hydrolase activator EnvC [Thermoleophilia bacterium]
MSRGAGRRGPRAAALAVALAAGALAGGVAWSAPADEKADVDQRLDRARDRLESTRSRESVLTGEVQGYSDRIAVLERRLAPLRARAERLQAELDSLEARLAELTERLEAERARLQALLVRLDRRRDVLGVRLTEVYVRGEPDLISVLLDSGSLNAAVETVDALQMIASRDRDIADSIKRTADEVRATRDRIAAVRRETAEATARAAAATAEANAAKAGLERQESGLKRVLDARSALLASVKGDRREIEEETRGLERRSAALAAKIVAAQGAASVAVGPSSPGGFAWPVSGPITSGFGPRWGRMHEGIDIAVGSGTPVGASKAGTVIVAGWNGGYGNLVVVDHGGGISTAYAHNTSISVSVGQSVGQGQVLAYSGSTGNSTGPHVHFEVRVNGSAVNPLGYL